AEVQAKRTIDAAGKVMAPGFIDMLGQSELTILVEPRLPSKIYQGITTEITGEGGSAAPQSDALVKADQLGYDHLHLTADCPPYPPRPRAPAASTPPTCAARGTPSSRPSTRRSASAARPTFRSRSGTSRWRAGRTGAACPRSSRKSKRPARPASTSRRTPTPI